MTAEAKDGRAEIALQGPGYGGGGLRNSCVIDGDFDVSVDFALLEWPTGGGYIARLGAYGLGEGPGGGIGISRYESGPNGGYILAAEDTTAVLLSSDAAGTIRLTRTGSTLTGYARTSSGWQQVGSGNVPTSETYFALDVGTSNTSAPGGALAAFDNFAIASGTRVRK